MGLVFNPFTGTFDFTGSGGGGGGGNVSTSGLTAGRVTLSAGATSITDDAELTYDPLTDALIVAGLGTAASLTTALTGLNNDLVFTAFTGATGNTISIQYSDVGPGATLSVDITGTAILVTLGTDGGGFITSTAADVQAAIEGVAAGLLDSIANAPGNDGSGLVTAMAPTLLSGGISPLTVGGEAVVGGLNVGDGTITYQPEFRKQFMVRGAGTQDPAVAAQFQKDAWGNNGFTVFGTGTMLNLDSGVFSVIGIGGTNWATPSVLSSSGVIGGCTYLGWDGANLQVGLNATVRALQDFDMSAAVEQLWAFHTGSQWNVTGAALALDTSIQSADYKSSDGTSGNTGGPYGSVTVKNGLVVSGGAGSTGNVTTSATLTSGQLIQGNGGVDITLNATTATVTKLTSGVPSAATAGTDYTALAFKTIAVSGQSDVVADGAADTLTLVASTGMTITTDASTDTITFVSSGAASDYLSTLTAAEISITATGATFTINRQHVISGTSSDYTVSLPAASGNTGKFLSLRVANTATKIFTIDGNGSETIDGALTRIVWAGESATLYCDGSNWFKISGKTIPMCAVLHATADQTGVAATTWTRVDMTSQVSGVPQMYDSTNKRITIVRPGTYHATGFLYATGGALTYAYIAVDKNAVAGNDGYNQSTAPVGVTIAAGSFDVTYQGCAAADYINVSVYSNGTSYTILGAQPPTLGVFEIVTW